MDVLLLPVEQQQAAVVVVGQLYAVLGEEVGDDLVAQLPQIAGDDEVVVVGGESGILKVGFQGVIGGGGRGQIRPIRISLPWGRRYVPPKGPADAGIRPEI